MLNDPLSVPFFGERTPGGIAYGCEYQPRHFWGRFTVGKRPLSFWLGRPIPGELNLLG